MIVRLEVPGYGGSAEELDEEHRDVDGCLGGFRGDGCAGLSSAMPVAVPVPSGRATRGSRRSSGQAALLLPGLAVGLR